MNYDEMVKNDMPRWVIVDLNTSKILDECWTWFNADCTARDAELMGCYAVRIYDRMNEEDCKKLEQFKRRE